MLGVLKPEGDESIGRDSSALKPGDWSGHHYTYPIKDGALWSNLRPEWSEKAMNDLLLVFGLFVIVFLVDRANRAYIHRLGREPFLTLSGS